MNNTNPLISVIIPVYNGAGFLVEALDSVARQTYRPLEIIVIDDGSTDDTAQVFDTFFAGTDVSGRYVFQENQGPAAARNHGLSLAGGEFIAFLDADDLWPTDKLTWQLACFHNDPTLDIVLGRTRTLITQSETGEVSAQDTLEPHFYLLLGCAVLRRRTLATIGPFNASLRRGSEDLDWFLRVYERRIARKTIPQVTLIYRIHSANMTRGKRLTDLDLMRMLKLSLDRRRQAISGRHSSMPRLLKPLPFDDGAYKIGE